MAEKASSPISDHAYYVWPNRARFSPLRTLFSPRLTVSKAGGLRHPTASITFDPLV